jgi:catechol 2,3-dioxygenase-like lactoylglutathione lyase family enzyme
MLDVKGVAHFSIPVTEVKRSVDWYAKVVGLKLIRADDRHAFMDAGGVCVLLCRETPPITRPEGLDFVHHSFAISPEQYAKLAEHLAACGVKILYTEDLAGGTVNGPRTYFRDPDGTRLEIINLTSYNPNPVGAKSPTERNRKEGGVG